MHEIIDNNGKLSINGTTIPRNAIGAEWKYIPFEELCLPRPKRYNKMRWAIRYGRISWYFINCFIATGLDGTLNTIYITKDKPRTWQTDFTPPNGETRHIEIDHDDLTPEKLAEVCK